MTMEKKEQKRKKEWEYIGIGLCIGVVFGIAAHQLAIGIALGLCLGNALRIKNKIGEEHGD